MKVIVVGGNHSGARSFSLHHELSAVTPCRKSPVEREFTGNKVCVFKRSSSVQAFAKNDLFEAATGAVDCLIVAQRQISGLLLN